MFVERLDFTNPISNIELSIHISRYSLAKQFCKNSKVLDVACGEGYGSFIMSSLWQASLVSAVDISEQAINVAKSRFSQENIDYYTYDAECVDELFDPYSFDLIISLETIEHVRNPKKFISALKKILKPNGTLIISCPNDYWYYKSKVSSNPYHLHVFLFEEFQQLCTQILGDASFYLFGFPISGFGNFPITGSNYDEKQASHLSLLHLDTSKLHKILTSENLDSSNASYFVGIWSYNQVTSFHASGTFYPISMDSFEIPSVGLSYVQALRDRVQELENFCKELENYNKELVHALADTKDKRDEFVHSSKIQNRLYLKIKTFIMRMIGLARKFL